VNVPAKFEVRSFTRSRDNRGYFSLKLWAVPGHAVQGLPRSFILVPNLIESVCATSYKAVIMTARTKQGRTYIPA